MNRLSLFFTLIFSLVFTKPVAASYYEAPVAGAVAGFQIAGPKGAAFGLLVGCADEVLVSAGFFEKRYMTAGALGAGLLQPMALPNQINEGIGFLAGLLMATGYLTPWLDTLSGPLTAGIMGASLAGASGAFGGMVCGGVDAFAMSQQWTDRPYLGTLLQSVSGANVLGGQVGLSPYWRYSAGAILGAYLAIKDEPMVQTSALELGNKLYAFYSKLMDPKELDQLIEQHMLVVVSNGLAMTALGNLLSWHDARLENGITRIQETPARFFDSVKSLSKFVVPYVAMSSLSQQVTHYLSSQFSSRIETLVFDNYLVSEAPLKLSLDNRTQVQVAKLRENTKQLGQTGNGLLSAALESGSRALFQVVLLSQKNSLDLIPFSGAYNQMVACVFVPLSKWHADYKLSIEEEENKVMLYDVAANTQADLIVPYDRLLFLKNKSALATKNSQHLRYEQGVFAALTNGFQMASRIAESILRYVFIGNKIAGGSFTPDERYQIVSAGHAISDAFSWATAHSVQIAQVEHQIESISRVLDAVQNADELDRPQLNFITVQGPELLLSLRDIKAGLDMGETKLSINHLDLKKGVYAVTGPSGHGKSTFLKKLKGLKHSYGWAEGEVAYQTPSGEFPKVTFISQKDYLMPYSSLIEIILSKTEYSVAELARVQELVKEIDLNKTDLLTQKPNWEELSGGERKKVSIISAIIQNPDILILDEPFTGLDPVSLEKTQGMLKKYLPNTMFLVVEQQLDANRRFDFYDYELKLYEGRVAPLLRS